MSSDCGAQMFKYADFVCELIMPHRDNCCLAQADMEWTVKAIEYGSVLCQSLTRD